MQVIKLILMLCNVSGCCVVGMEAWKELFVPDEVLWALRDQGFKDPTPIQSQVLASAIRDKMDIVGAAETVRQNVSLQFLCRPL